MSLIRHEFEYVQAVVEVGQNAPELRPSVPRNFHLAFLGPKCRTTFLPELWSLAAGTLFRGLES